MDTFVGILLLRLIRIVIIPSAISIPRKTEANIHSRDGPSVFCGLPLRVIEVGWDTDNSVCDDSSQVIFAVDFIWRRIIEEISSGVYDEKIIMFKFGSSWFHT